MVYLSGVIPMQHYPTSYGMQELGRWWREHHPHRPNQHAHDKQLPKNQQKPEQATPMK
jgi:hypothetical protein